LVIPPLIGIMPPHAATSLLLLALFACLSMLVFTAAAPESGAIVLVDSPTQISAADTTLNPADASEDAASLNTVPFVPTGASLRIAHPKHAE